MDNPQISVIIPVYNAAKYLYEALESLVNQVFKDWEAWLINDGSTDGSLLILEEFVRRDSRFKILNQVNKGYGSAINNGLFHARGKYIAIFEPDDLLHMECYQKLWELAEKTGCCVVKANYASLWGNGKNEVVLINEQFSRFAVQSPLDLTKHPEFLAVHASVWCGLYLKDFLQKFNLKMLETPGAAFQDISFTFKTLISARKVGLIDEPLYYYRQDNTNSSINNVSKIYCICDEFEEIEKFLKDFPDKKYYMTQKLINQYRGYLWTLSRIDKKFIPKFIEKFSAIFKEYWNNGLLTSKFFRKNNYLSFKILIKYPWLYCRWHGVKMVLKKIKNWRKKILRLHLGKGRCELIFFGIKLMGYKK